MRRRHLAAVAAVVLVLASCSSGPRYDESDVLPEADLTFPGATETDSDFSPDESGRSIHLDDLTSPARLDRSFDLVIPTPSIEIYEWYEQELTQRGWTSDLGLDGAKHYAEMDFRLSNGSRTDVYSIDAGFVGTTVMEFDISYVIDVEADG